MSLFSSVKIRFSFTPFSWSCSVRLYVSLNHFPFQIDKTQQPWETGLHLKPQSLQKLTSESRMLNGTSWSDMFHLCWRGWTNNESVKKIFAFTPFSWSWALRLDVSLNHFPFHLDKTQKPSTNFNDFLLVYDFYFFLLWYMSSSVWLLHILALTDSYRVRNESWAMLLEISGDK